MMRDWMRALALGTMIPAITVMAPPLAAQAPAKVQRPDTILYGVAYYDEYTPVDRVDEDARMMKAAGITVVRIAESTWGTLERQPGAFDFTHVDRMLGAMHKQGIKVIVGTPTYAVPTWLARQHPDVLLSGYGHRQNMDITNPEYLAAAERMIVALIDHVKDHPAVIGYQIDNETKANGVATPRVQAGFVAMLKKKFGTLDALNKAWGLDYWSNRINRWEDFPDVTSTINASMRNAFEAYQRSLIADFLMWQAKLVRAHSRTGQFITQNFDLGWAGYSYGLRPEVDHWEAAKAIDVTGVDIYHPSQSQLTGTEIAFGGDLARSIRNGENYLVLETEAQGFPWWTPYPGQLRLQAFSHLASGADLKRLGPKLVGLKKRNKVALYVSNAALSAFDAFRAFQGDIGYNDIVRRYYDALYRQNIEVDLVSPSSNVSLDQYSMVVVPALYAASDAELTRLNDFAKAGGHVLYTVRSGFSDENTKVRYGAQPGGIAEAAGATYQLFTIPDNVKLEDDPYAVGADHNRVFNFMEMLKPTTGTVVARYDHPAWSDYAAITRNRWGKGEVTYVGFVPDAALAEKIVAQVAERAGVASTVEGIGFPLIVRGGTLSNGNRVRYVMNYSGEAQQMKTPFAGLELISAKRVADGQTLDLPAWGFAIVEENGRP